MIATALLFLLAAEPVVVRTNAAFEPCVSAHAAAFSARTGQPVRVEVGDPSVATGADVVVGDDSETTRLVEGGTLEPFRDVGTMPWVLVTRAGADPVTAAAAAVAGGEVVVPDGRFARAATAYLQRLGARQVRATGDAALLRNAPSRLVPRSLASGAAALPTPVRRLIATAGVVHASPRAADAERFVLHLAGAGGSCFDAVTAGATAQEEVVFARSVVDWWLPACTLARNLHNDPNTVVGAPNSVRLAADRYSGMFSLGQGGWVIVDPGVTIVDGPGVDLRVFQTTSGEEVTVYASANPTGPWSIVGLREYCGFRVTQTISSCDFDLANANLSDARYLKIEDGELYPCLAGSTASEGADIDAVQIFHFR